MADRFKIISGPSKYDLMLALFERKPVTFVAQRGAFRVEVPLRIEALFNEYSWATITLTEFSDDSDGNWFIEGVFAIPVEEKIPRLLRAFSRNPEDYIIRAAYSSVNRDGILRCVERQHHEYDEHLRFELGDRIWGGQAWREKEL